MILAMTLLGCGSALRDSGTPEAPPYASVVVDAQDGGVLLAAWSAGDDVLMVGGDWTSNQGLIVRWSGGNAVCTDPEPIDQVLWWVHGRSPDDWYAVGEKGTIVHEVGGIRIREDVPTEATLFGVFDDGVDVWAVGGNVFGDGSGEIWRKQGANWELFDVTPGLLFKVWNGWFVGADYAAQKVGEELVERPLPNGERILTVRGASDTDLWIVGGLTTPVLMHWNNDAWVSEAIEPICGSRELMGVWTAPDEDVYISGESGTTAQFDGAEWTCDSFPVSSDAFHAVWKHNDDVFWVGGNISSSGPYHYTIARLGDHPPMTVNTCE